MKKLFFLSGLLTLMISSSAQTLQSGKDHLYYQRYNTAKDHFQAAVKADPQNAETWYWLAKSYILLDQNGKAKDTINLASESVKQNPWYMVAYGSTLLNENNGDAVQFFQKAIDETKKKNADILAAVADAHIMSPNGNATYAIELLQLAMKRDKKNPNIDVAIGNAYRKMHNGTDAYSAYQAAIQKNSSTPEAYFQLGQIFLTQKNPSMYLDFFNKAIEADKEYAPAYFELYEHYLYTEPSKAMEFFQLYAPRAEESVRLEYARTDLLYLTKKYDDAIAKAKTLIASQGEKVQPRLYKLIAYSYQDLKDSSNATSYMQQYFQNEEDSNLIVKDFETMAGLFMSADQKDSAISYYASAANIAKDSAEMFKIYKTIANAVKPLKDYAAEAKWLGKYYVGNPETSNIDLFNWGLASYRAGDYVASDSVFGMYAARYPEQGHGYYWRARSNAAIDTAMTLGIAIPHYQKLIEVIKDDLTENNKKWLVQAYGYLAAYETNTEKDYTAAIEYFKELLKADPENSSAKEYISMLEERIQTKENQSAPENTGSN
jgi:tetratricopeptide (TPR) repeat protein